jgi:signal transduction histidine kinase
MRITIADTGHGMTPTVRKRLFEPFYTTKDLNGTGLGLWISAGIVNRHHGRLTFRSSQDPCHHGSVFSLFLPSVEEARIELH